MATFHRWGGGATVDECCAFCTHKLLVLPWARVDHLNLQET
jgi:hypothetical protein